MALGWNIGAKTQTGLEAGRQWVLGVGVPPPEPFSVPRHVSRDMSFLCPLLPSARPTLQLHSLEEHLEARAGGGEAGLWGPDVRGMRTVLGSWGRDVAWLFWWGPLQPPAASQSPRNTLKQPLQKPLRGGPEASSHQLGE